jgi:hypothetical protein
MILGLHFKKFLLGIQFSVLSKHNCLLGIQYQKGTENVPQPNDERTIMEFSDVSIGVIFLYLRIAVYKKGEI